MRWICTQEDLYHTNHSITLLEYSSFLSKLTTLSITMSLVRNLLDYIHKLLFTIWGSSLTSIHKKNVSPHLTSWDLHKSWIKFLFLLIKRKKTPKGRSELFHSCSKTHQHYSRQNLRVNENSTLPWLGPKIFRRISDNFSAALRSGSKRKDDKII